MGDFAAGKMGTYSGPTGTASVEDVAQAIVDLEGLYESKVPALSCGAMLCPATLAASVISFTPRLSLSDQIAGIAPATVDAIAATGAPTDLAAALKKRDGGHYLFDYRLFSCSEMTAKKANRTCPVLAPFSLSAPAAPHRSDAPSITPVADRRCAGDWREHRWRHDRLERRSGGDYERDSRGARAIFRHLPTAVPGCRGLKQGRVG
eukprot:scaffold7704_cov112-Isochrysis_galbana.AAC.15